MKSIAQISILISEAVKLATSGELKKSKLNALKRKIAFYRQCKRYLETGPREEFVLGMKAEAKKHISCIDDRYGSWLKSHPQVMDKPLNIYRKEMGRNVYVQQIKTLDFILKDESIKNYE